jgi:hypothetical protein
MQQSSTMKKAGDSAGLFVFENPLSLPVESGGIADRLDRIQCAQALKRR